MSQLNCKHNQLRFHVTADGVYSHNDIKYAEGKITLIFDLSRSVSTAHSVQWVSGFLKLPCEHFHHVLGKVFPYYERY